MDIHCAPSSPINWQAPWWRPWRDVGQALEALWLTGSSVCDALNSAASRATVRFVPQALLSKGQAYEAFIFETKAIPTRDNLHDFLNGLVWLRFPLTKARLNALQYAEIAKGGVGQVRGPLRDALTLFDENAALLCSKRHAAIISALHRRDWHTAFQAHRALLKSDPPVLFGHALMEKLVSPYQSITAHAFATQLGMASSSALPLGDDLAALDAALAAQLSREQLVPKPFAPLTVLGVPGWWAANEAPNFYMDRTVFRPPRP